MHVLFDSDEQQRRIAEITLVPHGACGLDAFVRGYRYCSAVGFTVTGEADEGRQFIMAAKKKKKAAKKGKPAELIISKSRTKGAVKKCNVGSEFYPALDAAVRNLIKEAEARAVGNKRKTLKAVDI